MAIDDATAGLPAQLAESGAKPLHQLTAQEGPQGRPCAHGRSLHVTFM